MRLVKHALAVLAAAAVVVCSTGALSAQGVGSIRGRVLEENTLKPLSGVQVTVPGTGRGALSDESGVYMVSGVPAGQRAVSAQMLGYGAVSRSVTVGAGQVATADFTLSQQAVSLNEIVVTGTPGAVQKRTLGNTVTTINASDVSAKVANTSMVELLAAKTAGLTISGGSGTAGVAQNIKIRGTTSLNAGNRPVIYVDGVRISNGSLGNFAANCCADNVSSQTTDALGGVNPNDIESIEVVKGPAAATLYGSDAAAGVIQIITKKGKPGQQKLSWNAKVQMGGDSWAVKQPVNYTVCDAAKIAAPTAWPGCVGKTAGTRISQNVMTYDPNELRTGMLKNYSLGVRGGGDNYSFYIAGDYDDEQGIIYNNYSNRRSVRSNFAFNPLPTLDFSVNFGYTQQHVRLPKNDNDANGIMFNAMLFKVGAANPWGNNLQPDTSNLYDNQTTANTLVVGSTVNYRPVQWFRNRMTVGYNNLVSEANIFYAPGRMSVRLGIADTTGFIQQQIPRTAWYTVDYAGTITARLRPNIGSDFSFGAQFLANRYRNLYGEGAGLSSAFNRLITNAARRTATQEYSASNSLGFFAQEQVGLNDRLFITGGVRMDNSSVFGDEVKRTFYPKLSGSWVVSDEHWFHLPATDNLRLRAAWGQAGKAPAPYAATRTYTSGPVTLANGSSVPAIFSGAYGNQKLEAERGTEIEAGFDASMLKGRAGVELTYYNKHMKNGLIAVDVPPSSGWWSSTAGTYYDNALDMKNEGLEAILKGTPIQRTNLSWDATLNIATNRNRLISFGTDRKPYLVGYYGTQQGLWPGYPVYAFWARNPKRDASGNVVIVNGVAQPGDTSYVGPSQPTREIGFSNTVTFLKHFSVYALFDYKGGFYQYNVRDWRRALAVRDEFMTNPNSDPTTVAIYKGYPQITAPWIQKADFIKMRDLSLTFTIPTQYTRMLRSDRASITLAAHNLGILWTEYGGLDPEANFNGADDFRRTEAWTLPMQRRLTAAVNVSF